MVIFKSLLSLTLAWPVGFMFPLILHPMRLREFLLSACGWTSSFFSRKSKTHMGQHRTRQIHCLIGTHIHTLWAQVYFLSCPYTWLRCAISEGVYCIRSFFSRSLRHSRLPDENQTSPFGKGPGRCDGVADMWPAGSEGLANLTDACWSYSSC